MKEKIHPPYQEIVFVDSGTGTKFLCGSTLQPKEREEFEGKEYPVSYQSVTSASHPFFTGEGKFVDSEGRVGKFQKRYQMKQQPQEAKAAEAPEKGKKKVVRKKPSSK